MELQITGPSIAEIREALGVTGEFRSGDSLPLIDGATMKVEDVSKSSGFDATMVIVTAIVSIATTTTSALLIEWLKSRLLKSGPKTPITIVVEGKEIRVQQ